MLVVPTPMWVRGCTGPPMLLLGPLKGGGGGRCGPLSRALGDGDVGLSPVTPKRISLAGAVGGCGRAPSPAETGCHWG